MNLQFARRAPNAGKIDGNGQPDEARRRLAAAHRRARPSRAPVLDRLPDALTLPRRQASNGDSNEENKENGSSENGNSENGLRSTEGAMPCNPRKAEEAERRGPASQEAAASSVRARARRDVRADVIRRQRYEQQASMSAVVQRVGDG